MHLQGTKQELPALTGIRFLAALTVVIAHGMVLVVQFSNTPRFIGEIRNFSGLGMSLFFVLSGFVIHYNYRESVTKPYGIYNFFIARFARLYPLFISVFVAELVYAFVRHRIPPFGFDLRALPYYLTLTQTWWYAVFKDHSLIYQFGEVAQVSWSISTEAWFYFAYLGIVLGLRKLNKPGTMLAAIVGWCLLALIVVLFVSSKYPSISDFGGRYFGEIAEEAGQDSFFRWLVYFSPYSRVSEFLLGCLTAHLFLQLSDRPVGVVEARLGLMLPWLAVLGMAATHALLFLPDLLPVRVPGALANLHRSFGFAPSCAALIFAVARYRNWVTQMLSWRPVVALGDASYSIYLLHLAIFIRFSASPAAFSYSNLATRLAHLAVAIMILFVASRIVYLVFEIPARRWIRQRFAISNRRMVGPRLQISAMRAVAWGIMLLPAASFAYVLAKGVQHGDDMPKTSGDGKGEIKILSAVYGGNCTSHPMDATRFARRHCENRAECDYVVSAAVLGDPAPGCSKDFQITWRCSPEGPIEGTSIEPEAGFRGIARVRCPAVTSRASN